MVLQINFESGVTRTEFGKKLIGGDYWLSTPGPRQNFVRQAEISRKSGTQLAAKLQTGKYRNTCYISKFIFNRQTHRPWLVGVPEMTKQYLFSRNVSQLYSCGTSGNSWGCRYSRNKSSMEKVSVHGSGMGSMKLAEIQNIEVIWLLGELKPDHWTICKFRRENKNLIRSVAIEFREFLMTSGYIEGKTGF